MFGRFAQAMSLPFEAELIKSLVPPLPDILYLGKQHPLTFELAEICASDVAHQGALLRKTGGVSVIWTCDPTEEILLSKLSKSYSSEHPIELLCFNKNRVIPPDSHVGAQISATLNTSDSVNFRRIWYFGEKKIFEFSAVGQLLNTVTL